MTASILPPHLQALLADPLEGAPVITLTPKQEADLRRNAQRSQATGRNRAQKREQHQETLESVGGDREKLKTIHVWVPRSKRATLYAKGYSKLFVGALKRKDDEDHDDIGKRAIVSTNETSYEAEFDETCYDLTAIEVERAAPPKDEIEFAKLQGRYRETQPSIQGFFAPTKSVQYAREVESFYAPLGDFEWANDTVPHAEREATRARWATQPNYKIKNHDRGRIYA